MLRSSLARLLSLPQPLTGLSLSKAQRTSNAELEAKIAAEEELFLARRNVLYIGFSQIIGTGQYVALGMVLLGILARVCAVIQSTESVSSDSENEATSDVLAEQETADHGIIVQRVINELQPMPGNAMSSHDITADAQMPAECLDSSSALLTKKTKIKRLKPSSTSSGIPSRETGQESKAKRKKRKISDEIDSIFG